MEQILKWVASNSMAATIAFGVVIFLVTFIYLVAFFQGREISFWPPKIGIKPDKTKQEGAKNETGATVKSSTQVNRIAHR